MNDQIMDLLNGLNISGTPSRPVQPVVATVEEDDTPFEDTLIEFGGLVETDGEGQEEERENEAFLDQTQEQQEEEQQEEQLPDQQETQEEQSTQEEQEDADTPADGGDADTILQDMGFDGQQTEEITAEAHDPDARITEEAFVAAATQQAAENSITPNSPTLLMDDATSRFSGTTWYDAVKNTSVIIAGIGGIGSNLAYQVARLHPKSLLLYDDDSVEVANMSGQLFGLNDIGRKKVDAMARFISSYTSVANSFAIPKRFMGYSQPADIMMCGFDSMTARETFFRAWFDHVSQVPEKDRHKCLFLDGRLSIDTLQVFALRGDDDDHISRYHEEFLFSDKEADPTVCSLKQTTYMACMIASVMTNIFVNFVNNTLSPEIPSDVPFFTEYDSTYMIFRNEQ